MGRFGLDGTRGRDTRKPRIAIIGARGIPAQWGGYETFAAELAPRLVDYGFEVEVYCRSRYSLASRPATWRRVRLKYLPTVYSKRLESPVAELLCAVDSLLRPPDLLYVLGMRAPGFYLPHRLRRIPLAINTDGFDWKRAKWGRVARTVLRLNETVAVMLANQLISDSMAVANYYRAKYARQAHYISYGVPKAADATATSLDSYGLRKGQYFLVVARMEPENNLALIQREYIRSGVSIPLVIVGGANYSSSYVRQVQHDAMGHNIQHLGPVYEPGRLDALYRNCLAYVHGHEVGGTNPALLHAIGAGAFPVVLDVPFNVEVVREHGRKWRKDAGSLAAALTAVVDQPQATAEAAASAQVSIGRRYRWEEVAARHAELFHHMISARAART